MSPFIKNKKFLLLFPILFIVFSFFLVVSTMAGCDTNCTDCPSSGQCSGSPLNCEWDTNENECCSALEIGWPSSPGGTPLTGCSDVGDMVQYFYEWAIGLGGIATFVALVWGGFLYITSMGRPEAMKEARSRITSAFFGLILLLSSWLILNTINPDLTTFRRTSYNLEYLNTWLINLTIERLPSCDYVLLYELKEYGSTDGKPMKIPNKGMGPPEDERLTVEDNYREIRPRSSKAFVSGALPEFRCDEPDPITGACECPEYGCGCVLQLFETTGEGTADEDLCGSKIGEMSATSPDLLSGEARKQEITCVRLSGTGCQCRELTNEGNCTTKMSVDTAWGDNEFRCFGKNRRCLDGKCIPCRGTILADGCDGCAAKVMAPDSPKTLDHTPSELACWHVGDSGHFWNFAPSCTATCKDKAGKDGKCVQANWNDDGSCNTGKQLWSCSGCNWVLSLTSDPGYWGSSDECSYRDGFNQDCDKEYWKFARRFCVCDR